MIGLIDSWDVEYNGTENEALFKLVCDSAAELSSLTHYDNIKIRIGSECTVIATGDKYLKSSSAWVLQPSANQFQNVYTKTEVDTLLTPIRSNITNLQSQQTKDTNALINLMGVSGKNHLRVTGTGRTHNGITFTVNSDGTVTANGTATANAYIQVSAISTDSELFDGSYRLCGCPEGGSRQSYAQYAALSSYARYDYGESVSLIPTEGLTGNVNFIIMIYAGYTADNVIFKPMICKEVDYLVSPEFAPYCPTLPELYAIVRGYHA